MSSTDFIQLDFGRDLWLEQFIGAHKPIGPTFHPFPRLPTELRLAIWGLCLPPPRRVCYYHGATWQTKQSLQMPSPPITLWVSQESRFVTLKRYTLTSVASEDQYLYKTQYLSLSTDIFDTDNLMSVVVRSNLAHPVITSHLAQIQRMLIETSIKGRDLSQHAYPIRHRLLHPVVKGALPALREIVVVVHGAWYPQWYGSERSKEEIERSFQEEKTAVEEVVHWVEREVEKEGVKWNKPRLTVENCGGCESCKDISDRGALAGLPDPRAVFTGDLRHDRIMYNSR